MDKFYFSAKFQQEYADIIYEKVLSLGVPRENIVFKKEGCEFLYLGIYIKFNSETTYNKFKNLDLPGIVEVW